MLSKKLFWTFSSIDGTYDVFFFFNLSFSLHVNEVFVLSSFVWAGCCSFKFKTETFGQHRWYHAHERLQHICCRIFRKKNIFKKIDCEKKAGNFEYSAFLFKQNLIQWTSPSISKQKTLIKYSQLLCTTILSGLRSYVTQGLKLMT